MISASGSRDTPVGKPGMPAGSRPEWTASATRIWEMLYLPSHENHIIHDRTPDPFQFFYDNGLVWAAAFFREEQFLATFPVRNHPDQLGGSLLRILFPGTRQPDRLPGAGRPLQPGSAKGHPGSDHTGSLCRLFADLFQEPYVQMEPRGGLHPADWSGLPDL